MLDQPPTSLDQPLMQARQRPGVDSLRQHQPASFIPVFGAVHIARAQLRRLPRNG
jgi:hypothetical protein